MSKYKVERNHCTCHPETCGCNDWRITAPDGNKHSTFYHKATADEVANALNKANQATQERQP